MWALVLACLLAAQPHEPAAGAPKPPSMAADLSSVPLAELLAGLPDAAEELRWDEQKRTWAEDASSVELRRRIIHGDLADGDWPAALRAAHVIAVPRRWPKGRPLAVSLTPPLWLGTPGWIEITPRLVGARKVQETVLYGGCALGNDGIRERRRLLEVAGPLGPAATEVVFDVRLEARRLDGDHITSGHERRWHGTMSFPVQVVERDADVMEPVRDRALDDAVKGAISVTAGLNQGAPPRRMMWVQWRRTADIAPFLEKHACRAKVEVLDGAKVLKEFEIDLRDTPRSAEASLSQYVDTVPQESLKDAASMARLRLRITGTPELAVRDLRRSTCWVGQVEGALSEFVRP